VADARAAAREAGIRPLPSVGAHLESEHRSPDYVAAPDAIERPDDYDDDGTENSEPAAGVCGGHGAHPHDGRQCLDCPICRPSTKES